LSTEPLLIRCPFQYAPVDMEADPRCQATLVWVTRSEVNERGQGASESWTNSDLLWVRLWVGSFRCHVRQLLEKMAGTTGLEPAASAVTV